MKLSSLDEVLDYIRGVTFKPDQLCQNFIDDSVVCMRTKNVQAKLDLSDLISVPKKIVKREEQLLLNDDLLISSANSWNLVGKAVQVKNLDYPATAGGFISILRPKKEIVDGDYLYWFITSDKTQEQIRSLANKTTNISNLDRKRFLKLKIPLPPLETQKKIAEILSQADLLRQQAKQMETELNQLAQSIFIDMFGDPANNTKGWLMGKIRDCCESVNYGSSSKADERVGHYPMLRMNNITYSGGWNFDSLKYIDLSENDQKKYLVKKGDLLFNRTNSKELVGKTAVFNSDKEMAFAGYLIRLRVNEKAIPEYISAFLNSKYGKLKLQSMCKNIVGMANINAKELQNIDIPMPDIKLQQKFQAIINEINSKQLHLDYEITEYQELFNSLMQKAFKGELVA